MKVLTYHRVNSVDGDPLTVKTEMFLRHLDYLEDRGFSFISPEELISNSKCKGKRVLLTFEHGFHTGYEVISPILKAKKYPAIFFVATDSIGKDGMLSFDQIRSLRRSGFSIGSHTVSHPCLTRIPMARAKKEIEDSKKLLEDYVGEKVDFFSYPYGDLNVDIINLVKEAGYKAGFLISPWWRRYRYSEFTIPRCGLYHGTNFFLFRLKML